MLNKWKMLLVGVISVFLLMGLVACGDDSDESASSDGGETETEDSGDDSTADDEAAEELEEVEIRFSWWGDTGRNEVYNEIVDRFEEKYPHITVQREFGGWEDYWDRLATQIAGGNAPDVISMHQFYVSDYARRGALRDIQELMDAGVLDLSDFEDSAIDSGKVDDTIYMVAKGITMPGWAYNTAQFDELGVDYPDLNWTWDDFVETVHALNDAMGSDDHWGVQDMSGGQLQPNFRYFVRQRGNDLFDDEGKLAFDEDDVREWWTMWDDLRQAGAIPDAATGNEFEGAPLEANMFVTGRTALVQIPANQLYLYQQQFDDGELRMVRMPHIEGGANGEYIEGAYLSIAERSDHPEEAAMFIDFFVNAEESIELFKVEQGPPAGTQASQIVQDLIDPAQARAVEFIQEALPYGESAPYAPTGVSEVEQAFSDNAEAIAFGQKSVDQAVEDFMNVARNVFQ
ncbi:ABC transporter substrate-binding protein [Evansella cellulosilytica]|uniref:Extracellular solute-binding protein family 1 n=1 Tax=Evansella cellulosilytica (strain ATCC 21833 / DSM 2522 / FERM P-1141 / JCM 9156 / N-4) TaxID=649639 RepID=E6TTH5_EVAC2|nr:sugar ABC transporter substrate-binding protein [Evansella cellulosilytica]ADU29611.1 extracellular solute-binding protein family 1 [Evansella cellulosilytica DSM 2522]